MAIRISEALGIEREEFISRGVYDGFFDIDSLFYIDPRLLSTTTINEFQGSYQRFRSYYDKILSLISASNARGDRFWMLAVLQIKTKEIQELALGYAKSSRRGNAVGTILASNLADTAAEIIEAGIKDPIIFELAGLYEDNIGPDRISDMTGKIIYNDLLKYSDRITKELGIKSTVQISYSGKSYKTPIYPEQNYIILLLPEELLTPLPVAYDWSDIDRVCALNNELRRAVNKIIGNTWKQATNRNRVTKKELKSILIKYPEIFNDLIEQYNGKKAKGYNFKLDPLNKFRWYDVSQQYSKEFPLDLKHLLPLNVDNIFDLVIEICNHFQGLIEDNGLFTMLYHKKKLLHERIAQLLFYGIADAYCKANDVDINREPNSGRGSVDFKFSVGYSARVTVEVKYSSNSNLVKGYTNQLPTYNKAEKTQHSIYLILQVTDSRKQIDRVLKLKEEYENRGERTPEIIETDARNKLSASSL